MKEVRSELARRDFRDLLDDAQRGETARISRNGKPVAVLVPVEWYEHQRAALAAFAHEGISGGDPPVSAREVRGHVVMLAALLDGLRNNVPLTEPLGDFWRQLNAEVDKLAALLPENAEEE